MSTLSERLAVFAADLTYADIPERAQIAAMEHLADTVGVGLAGASLPEFAAAVVALAEYEGEGPASVWLTAQRKPETTAALINGTILHGLDFDDTHQLAVMHASASVVPTALALAEANHLSGTDAVAAMVAGYEVGIRIGMAADGEFHARGFHPTGVCGAFAATITAGKLMGFSRQQLVHAMGIVGSQAAGVFEYLADGSWVKRLHPGWAANSGITAARLAWHGFTGPATILEGRFGVYRTHLGGAFDPSTQWWDTMGRTWETENMVYKAYPSCHLTHAFITAALQLRTQVPVSEIERVVCRVAAEARPIVCEPRENKVAPRSDYEAKFSLPFCVAAALVDGEVNIATFSAENINRSDLLEISGRTVYEDDPASDFPNSFPGWLVLETRGGQRVESQVRQLKGSPQNPMTTDEIRQKFLENAAFGPAVKDAAGLWAFLADISKVKDVSTIREYFQESV